MKKNKNPIWRLLILPPLFFLVIIVVFSIVIGADSSLTNKQIGEKLTEKIPEVLLCSQVFMFIMVWYYAWRQKYSLFRSLIASYRVKEDVLFGVTLGVFIAVSYKFFIAESIVFLQSSIGDYVPTEGLSKISSRSAIFLIANVLLAPFVEESIYRNLVFENLLARFNKIYAVLISSVFFGLLHWMGGIWYILATGILVGLPFAIIRLKRKSVLLVFVAHITLNVFEFFFI